MLVKLPQSSRLPDKQVRGGRVDDENLRRAALDKVTKKAETLGFTVVAHADSPVAGGSGTIEILAHLRFAGRPALLPADGESRGHKPKPTRPTKGARLDRLTWFAVVAPGLEEVRSAGEPRGVARGDGRARRRRRRRVARAAQLGRARQPVVAHGDARARARVGDCRRA